MFSFADLISKFLLFTGIVAHAQSTHAQSTRSNNRLFYANVLTDPYMHVHAALLPHNFEL